jgi:aspartate/methionine/tyrosine aminotransferase
MNWAKTKPRVPFNLATSGLDYYPLSKLPVKLEDLEISGPSTYGYKPLQERLAAKSGVSEDCVVANTGASGGNHLAMAALIEPGDEVLIEHPAYELLVSTAEHLGANVTRFSRPAESSFRIDLGELERRASLRTRLIVLTNLQNPTSAQIDEEEMRAVGEIARRCGSRVLVDEIYLDADFEGRPWSAFQLGPEFVVTNSLTKVYGLSGLRCGWILAERELAQKMWRLNDLFGSIPAHPAELISCIALDNLEAIKAHSRALLDANRSILNAFLASRNDLEGGVLSKGTVSFPRLRFGDVSRFCKTLLEEFETLVVPGRYFGMAEHVRIGIGGDSRLLEEGLQRIGTALDKLAGS